MRYSLEFFLNGSLKSDEDDVKNESVLESLLLKLDAEKYVSVVLTHSNSNILTVSGGRQSYVILFSDANRVYELTSPEKRGGDFVSLRTGHTVGKFPPEMVTDPFTAMNIIKSFYSTGKRSPDVIWKPLI